MPLRMVTSVIQIYFAFSTCTTFSYKGKFRFFFSCAVYSRCVAVSVVTRLVSAVWMFAAATVVKSPLLEVLIPGKLLV